MVDLEEMQSKAIQNILREVKEMYGIWDEIGLNPKQQHERVKTAWDHIYTLVQDIKCEEISLCEELKSKIRLLTEKVSDLSRALCIEPVEVAGLTYLQRLEALEKESNRLSDVKCQRIKELEKLRIVEQKYNTLLSMEEYKLSFATEVPSEKDLIELQQHINMLAQEHAMLYKKYCQAKQQLSTILEVTEAMPETTLEKHLCSDKDPVSLSRSTFQEIEDIIARAKRRKEELENKKRTLIDKLNLLWERLNIENSSRIEFLSNHMDCKASTLLAIQREVDKYEAMKKENLGVFIESVRKELVDMWDKCGASDLEKELFDPFFSKDITESILMIHEDEVERWQKYYKDVQHILEKIHKRNKLWELLKALDNKANNPERFKNRGGYLLREEKERSKLLRTFPTLEQEIKKAIEKYEAETKRKFLYLGEDYPTVMSIQWKERANIKENIKQEKYSTPSKRIPSRTPSKSPHPKFAIYLNAKTPQKALVQKRELCVLKETGNNLKENPSCSNTTSYPDFETELNRTGRKSLRSSVVASKKIGGTWTPTPPKKQDSSPKKRDSLVPERLF